MRALLRVRAAQMVAALVAFTACGCLAHWLFGMGPEAFATLLFGGVGSNLPNWWRNRDERLSRRELDEAECDEGQGEP